MEKRKLPVGIQTFSQIREEGYYYVDKTAHARRIVDGAGKHYFLSRPRRFGKSLFVDTLKELYEGNESLFRGLAVHDAWDWSKRSPVVRLSFAGGNFKRPAELHASVMRQLAACERRAGLPASDVPSPAGRFADLLEALHDRTGERVVVLVDEYDRPILDALEGPAPAGERGETPAAANAQATANRDDLRGLYGTIKDCDAYVELTFITGVSRFSKVSLFSGLNNLTDLTLNPRYSAICGYTDADLDTVFAPELPGLERDEIRAWYDGYAWRGSENVYNPYAILHLFASREFEAHWFETATPPTSLGAGLDRRRGAVPAAAGRHSARLAPPERHRPLRGLLVERLLCLVPGLSGPPGRGGRHQPRPTGHGVAARGVAERSEQGAALAQLKARRYADKYRAPGRTVHLIGVEISAEKRTSPRSTWSPPERRPERRTPTKSRHSRRAAGHAGHRARVDIRLYFGYTRAFAGGMMVTRVQKWGNSQGLRIAKSLLEEVGIHVGDQVRISIRDQRLVVEPAATVRGRHDLRALVADMPNDYRVAEEDWGPPVGREVW